MFRTIVILGDSCMMVYQLNLIDLIVIIWLLGSIMLFSDPAAAPTGIVLLLEHWTY